MHSSLFEAERLPCISQCKEGGKYFVNIQLFT
uniref:Uncharacterized protein n=1 Tax=Anguilla anguilla TaxID=7936 RepID=A0A0E9SML6_ANGAN